MLFHSTLLLTLLWHLHSCKFFIHSTSFFCFCLFGSFCVSGIMLDTSFSAKMFLHTFESQSTRFEPHSLSFPEKDPYSHFAKDFSRVHEHPAVYEQPAPDCKHLESRVCVLFYFIPCTQQTTWSTETKSVSVNDKPSSLQLNVVGKAVGCLGLIPGH